MVTAQKPAEAARIFAWRQKRLENLGANPVLASETALNNEIDIHKIEKLVKSGCSIVVAIWIVR